MNETRRNDYRRLIKEYGESGKLYTFDYCSDYGLELAGSTIDKIETDIDKNVRFYYNENTNDYVSIENVSDEDLRTFYNGLKEVIWEQNGMTEIQKNMVYTRINEKFNAVFSDSRELKIFADDFFESVVEDVNCTADWSDYDGNEINLDDVDMSIARMLREAVRGL